MENTRHHYHSFFWPTILIGVGVIWLLVNFGIIAPVSIGMIWQFWPLLLIMLGLDILFSRHYAWVGSLVGILAVGGLVAYLIMQPHTGLQTTGQILNETFTAPLGETTAVTYNLETASEPVHLYALNNDSSQLIDANLTHQGTIGFSATGTTNKMVTLTESSNPTDWFAWTLANGNLNWEVGLTTKIPADVKINGGSGSIDADLESVNVQSLSADLGSGSSTFKLPQLKTSQMVDLNSGSGSVTMSIPAETDVTLRLQSASGSISISIPAGAAVHIEVMDSGSGSLSVPSGLLKISGDDKTGTWESNGYAQAAHHILIKILDRGSGSISIQ